jgi:hypothetical protein
MIPKAPALFCTKEAAQRGITWHDVRKIIGARTSVKMHLNSHGSSVTYCGWWQRGQITRYGNHVTCEKCGVGIEKNMHRLTDDEVNAIFEIKRGYGGVQLTVKESAK